MSVLSPWLLARTDPAIRVLSKTAHPAPAARLSPRSRAVSYGRRRPGPLDQGSRPLACALGARPQPPIPMPSRSVQPAGKRHLWRILRWRGRPKRAGCRQGMRGTAPMCMRVAVPAAADVRGVNPLGTCVRTRFRAGRGSMGTAAACAGCWRARQAGARAATAGPDARGRRDCRRRVRSHPHGGGVRPGRPTAAHPSLAAGCRGDDGEERSRAQVPGSGALLRKASIRTAPGNSGCGRLPASPAPSETAAGALWSPLVGSLGLCSWQAHNGHRGSSS